MYRYGGDEFIALLYCDTTVAQSAHNQRIDQVIKETRLEIATAIVDSKGREHFVGMSMGVVYNSVGINEWETVIKLADELMYDSKSFTGYVIACRTKDEVESRINLSDSIVTALTDDAIQPYLMSVYNATSKETVLYEVLGRWHNKGRKVMPHEFLPLIKRVGLSSKLDKFMLGSVDSLYNAMARLDEDNRTRHFSVNLMEDTLYMPSIMVC